MSGIVVMGEDEADARVNFRLLRPSLGGVSYDKLRLRVRLEGAPFRLHPIPESTVWSEWAGLHNCSVTFEMKTGSGRLRCKQYLYDLGPLSALDHAALFDHRPECMRAHRLDETRVAWTGYDYRKARALSMLAWGTSLELREVEGEHTREQLVEFARSFEPVGPPKRGSFADRTYWSRYPGYEVNMCRGEGYRPPSSLWSWRWPWAKAAHRWSNELPEIPLAGLRLKGRKVFVPEWHFDGACTFGDAPAFKEVQLWFEPSSGTGHARLWLRQFPRVDGPFDEPASGCWPPLDSFSGYRKFSRQALSSESGLQIYVASHHPEYGPHDAVFWLGDHGYLLQLSAAIKHDTEDLTRSLTKLLAEPVRRMREGANRRPAVMRALSQSDDRTSP